jgi:glycosyltransferase involved in cell wall biosynthesis
MGILDAAVAPLTTLCLATSEAAARSAVEVQHIAPDRVRVLENPVDLDRFAPPDHQTVVRRRQELGVPPGAPTVVCVARLFPVKGVDLLLTAWPEVVRAVPDAHLLIAGEGPLRADLEASVHGAGLAGSVHFLGFDPQVERVLQAGDLAVIPSRAEGFSLTALEAMATGLPVVAFAVGGLAEVVRDGRSGVLVPAGSTEGLAGAMVALLRDPDRRRAFGAAGTALASAYGLPASVERLKREYELAILAAARR